LSGALYSIRERYGEAAEEFRLILARDPTLVRPRLELARALFMARQYDAARYHFEQVLASPLPEAVKANVLAYLTLIRERVPSFAFSFDMVSDSNPKQATSSSIVEIGGLLYRLNQSALAQPAVGTLLTGQGKVPLPSDSSWFARGYVEHYDYPGADLDQGYGQLLAGKHLDLGPHGLDGVDPFFGVVRADSDSRAEISVTNRYLAYKGFAPRLTLGIDERRSNIEIYSFRRTYVRIGVVTEF